MATRGPALTLDPVPLCAALAEESRWQILRVLGARSCSASQLAEELPISRQAIARHLQVLEHVGLVKGSRHGRQIRYAALGGPLSQLASHLEAIGRGWDARLDRLARLAEAGAKEGADSAAGA